MTRNEIIRLSTEAGFNGTDHRAIESMLLKFAELVASAEREACARACTNIATAPSNVVLGVAVSCADAIRARGAA